MITLHFIHGFLGFPSDWEIFRENIKGYNYKFHAIADFLPKYEKNENFSFRDWANCFNQEIFAKKNNSEKNVLVGYSLGGRLALHALIENHDWDAALIVSANPGLCSENEKYARILNDKKWAERFLNDDWDAVMQAWNGQGVFSGLNNNIVREESQYNKAELACALTHFSLGRQEDLRPNIEALQIPLLWLAGEKDTKFVSFAAEMSALNNKIESFVVKDAGHRIPWEKPVEFSEKLLEFVKRVG
ncbi:alpha/beta fold hydrolase [Fluviispira vulneris]|uniref:alpha/beta fold hydrolase n=1 Tax=Fluviispira vulneris TaxID=2763012 RepID=UPI001643FC17|nr:alpha/beta fold hydrolase [Fluviispira vulneris]